MPVNVRYDRMATGGVAEEGLLQNVEKRRTGGVTEGESRTRQEPSSANRLTMLEAGVCLVEVSRFWPIGANSRQSCWRLQVRAAGGTTYLWLRWAAEGPAGINKKEKKCPWG